MTAATAGTAKAADPENTLYMRLSNGGTVTMELLPDRAPQHVERIKTLTKEGFYDGIVFHRVIEGFMAQTGDPTGTGMGGSDLPDLPAEFSDYPYKRGTVGAARTQDPNSANSQFFICFTDTGCSFLTGQYTVFAQVTDGMAEIDKVARGEPPSEPTQISKMFLGTDAPKAADTPAETPAATEAPAATETPAVEATPATETAPVEAAPATDAAPAAEAPAAETTPVEETTTAPAAEEVVPVSEGEAAPAEEITAPPAE